VRNLKDAEASGRFAKKLQTYLKPAVLVVDEIGCAPRGADGSCGMKGPAAGRRSDRSKLRTGRPPGWGRGREQS
jgi:IstB-like ATP binding protein